MAFSQAGGRSVTNNTSGVYAVPCKSQHRFKLPQGSACHRVNPLDFGN